MTLPFERALTVRNVREFLVSLTDPKQTPRVPMDVRRRARQLLKHYPTPFDMKRLVEKAPELFGTWGDT